MRVSKEKAAENRDRLLSEAARLFRERGLQGVGVDALAEAAGLTHGSLYSQFGSKEQLAAVALRHALAESAEKHADVTSLDDYARRYLSRSHRDNPGAGCSVAALGGEMPRQNETLRESFTDGVHAMTARVTRLLPDGAARPEDALAIVSTMVGALMLSRAVDDAELSDSILAAARRQIAAKNTA